MKEFIYLLNQGFPQEYMEYQMAYYSSSAWTWEQDKAFETALAMNSENIEDNWDKIASQIPGNKTIEEVKQHYQTLLGDIELIESGKVALPCYAKTRPSNGGNKQSSIARKKGKGKQWTEEEHRRFLLGLQTYGKGSWKHISLDFVKTRTPTQVASHAQKYFNRQINHQKMNGVRRGSIFDITSPNYNKEDYTYPTSQNETTPNINYEAKNKEVVQQQQLQQQQQQQQQYQQQQQQQQMPLFEPVDHMSFPESWFLPVEHMSSPESWFLPVDHMSSPESWSLEDEVKNKEVVQQQPQQQQQPPPQQQQQQQMPIFEPVEHMSSPESWFLPPVEHMSSPESWSLEDEVKNKEVVQQQPQQQQQQQPPQQQQQQQQQQQMPIFEPVDHMSSPESWLLEEDFPNLDLATDDDFFSQFQFF